jgi:hypothetical protein
VIAVKAYQTFPLLNIDVFHLSACPPAHMSPYSLPILPSVTCLPAFMFNTYRRTFHLFSFLSAFLPTSPLTHQDSHIYTFPTFRKPTCSFSHLIICPPALMLTWANADCPPIGSGCPGLLFSCLPAHQPTKQPHKKAMKPHKCVDRFQKLRNRNFSENFHLSFIS